MMYNSMSNVLMGGETVPNQNDELNSWTSQVEVPNPTLVGMKFAPLCSFCQCMGEPGEATFDNPAVYSTFLG